MMPPLATLRCGALSQVMAASDSAEKSKVVRTTKDGRRRQGSTSSLNKRTRKPRTEDAFRSIIAVPGDHRDQRDPLSLSLGGEFESRRRGGDAAADGGFPSHSPRYVPRGYPLAALERRGDASSPGGRSAASSSGGGEKGRRSTDYPYSGRHSPRYCPAGRHRDEMMASPPRDDDEQRRRPMTPPRQQRKPTGGGGGGTQGRRIRGEEDEGIGNSASTGASSSPSPSSFSSSSSSSLVEDARHIRNQGNNNDNDNDKCHSLQQMKLRQEILQSIHGRRQVYPTCPNCSGELTYLYISSSSSTSKRRKQPPPPRDDDNQSTPPRVSAYEIHDGDESARYKMKHLLPPLCVGCRTHLLFEGSEAKYLMMENFNKWVDKCKRGGSDTEDDEGYRHRRRGKASGSAGAYDFNDPRTPRYARMVIVSCTPTPLPLHNNVGSPPRRGNSSRGERELNDEGGMIPEEDTSTLSTYRRKGQLNYEHSREAVHDDDVKLEQRTKRNVPDENRQDDAAQSVNSKTTRKCDGKIFSFDEDLFLSDDSGDGREGINLIRTASEEQLILENYSMK